MVVDDFLKYYNYPLIKFVLKDKDFNILIYLNNIELICERIRHRISGDNTDTIDSIPKKLKVPNKLIEGLILDKNLTEIRKLIQDGEYIFTDNDIIRIIEEIEDYSILEIISISSNILWSDKLLDKYYEQWDWYRLSNGSTIDWNDRRIDNYKDKLNFERLSFNPNLSFSTEILNKYSKLWNWDGISGNPTIAKNSKNVILTHYKSVWYNEPEVKTLFYGKIICEYNGRDNAKIVKNDFETFNSIYSGKYYSENFNIKPCISTNSGVSWDIDEFKKFEFKIDTWLIALFGKLDNEIIYYLGDKLNEEREFRIVLTYYSDWNSEYVEYRDGWSNLMKNLNFYVDFKMLKFLYDQKIRVRIYKGNAMNGHSTEFEEIEVSRLVPAKKLKITFEELLFEKGIDFISKEFIKRNFINEDIYINILKPELLRNPVLVKKLFEYLILD